MKIEGLYREHFWSQWNHGDSCESAGQEQAHNWRGEIRTRSNAMKLYPKYNPPESSISNGRDVLTLNLEDFPERWSSFVSEGRGPERCYLPSSQAPQRDLPLDL